MPLYEYQCDACAHRFEVIQKFSDPPLTTCEKCGGAVRKLLSSPAIQFKGSGWYITDYARAGKSEGKSEGKADAKTDSSSKSATTDSTSASGSKTETKTESKPATPSTSS